MSDISEKRIKKFYQKNELGELDSFPIGAESRFVDFFSGLDLEEEILLGGNHTVDLKISGKDYEIIERYYTKSPKNIQYTIRTQVVRSIVYGISVGSPNLLATQNEELIVAIQERELQDYDIIVSQLYFGNYDPEEDNILLHTKYSVVQRLSDGGYKIEQQLDDSHFEDFDIDVEVD